MTPSTLFYYIGLEPSPSVNSRKKRFVNPIKIELTRSVRMETTLGKAPAIYNGHQPPRAVYPYVQNFLYISPIYHPSIPELADHIFKMQTQSNLRAQFLDSSHGAVISLQIITMGL